MAVNQEYVVEHSERRRHVAGRPVWGGNFQILCPISLGLELGLNSFEIDNFL